VDAAALYARDPVRCASWRSDAADVGDTRQVSRGRVIRGVEDAVEMAAAEMSEVENVVRRRVDGKSIASSLQDTLPHSIPLSLPRACSPFDTATKVRAESQFLVTSHTN
jgi:hypothetical protein